MNVQRHNSTTDDGYANSVDEKSTEGYASSSDDVHVKLLDGKRPGGSGGADARAGFQAASSLSTTRKYIIGTLIVVIIATTWVGSTQMAKSTYSGRFEAPFFVVWFGTAWMMAVFPLTSPLYFVLGPGQLSFQGIHELWR